VSSPSLQDRLGDCIYDYSGSGPPVQGNGVHESGNTEKDLRGESVLLSSHFFYFGRSAINLHRDLRPIIHQTQGHKSIANAPLAEEFIKWIEGLGLPTGQYGWPGMDLGFQFWTQDGRGGCKSRCDDDDSYSVC
jgi:hypothetical protein